MKTSLVITKPFDAHCHLREGRTLKNIIDFTAKHFGRAVVMGNLKPPIVSWQDAIEYRASILKCWPNGFEPIMTIMLTKQTGPEIVRRAAEKGIRVLKYIPEGVSTNSEQSVPLEKLPDYYPVLEVAQDNNMIFSGHWESLRDLGGRELHDLDRETAAIPMLSRTVNDFPRLRIVVEHASTMEMINYVKGSTSRVGCTLTIHHATLSYHDVCDHAGKIYNPHHYCKPILKSEQDRLAVLRAMLSGDPHFFFGSDSAPHLKSAKQKNPPPAGIFSAPVVLALLAKLFETRDKLDKLANFICTFGLNFYGLPQSTEAIEIIKRSWFVPEEYNGIVPLMAGKTLHWQVAE